MSNIVLLGLVSFFTDVSTQMIYPILPLFLTSVMGVGPLIIGIIEGIAESLASVLKLFSGIVSDRFGHKKRLAFFGYAASAVNKVIILFATTWTGVLVARVIDRFGKGIRTAPRDAMIVEAADKARIGKAFGLHKGMDLLGTAIGILLAWFILSFAVNGDGFRSIFLFSLIPAFIGLVILMFVKDKKLEKRPEKKVTFNWKSLDKRLKLFLVFTFLFTLGNSSNAFILLRIYDVGFSARDAILLYFVYSMTGSLLAFPAGSLSDKFGRKNLLCAGYLLYGIVYLGIALVSNNIAFIALFVIYGFYIAMTAGVERALIADLVPPENKASALGLHAAIVGIGLLPASIIAGLLWTWLGPSTPFLFGGRLGFITCVGVFIVLSGRSK